MRETSHPERAAHRRWIGVVGVTLIAAILASPLEAAGTSETAATAVAATPGPDDAEPTTPPSAPTTDVETTDVETTDGAATDGAADDEDDGPTAGFWLAVVLAAGLVGAAIWWMLTGDEEAEPPSDPDWPDTGEVI